MATTSNVVLITGCSTGIGRATAERLAGRGWKVYASARKLESIADLEDKGCEIVQIDVCDDASMTEAVTKVERESGGIGVLINNAGYGQEGPIEEVPMDVVRRQFETNVFGLVRMCQLVLPDMRERGWGRIINMSSMGGRFTLPGGGFYHATKYAVESISDALRFEVKGFGIDVVIIEPGPIFTEFGHTAVAAVDKSAEADGGPYASFKAAVKKNIEDAYDGPMRMLAADADAVAKVCEKAMAAPKPKTRYRVTLMAHSLVGMRWAFSDRMWDAFCKTLFPQPTP